MAPAIPALATTTSTLPKWARTASVIASVEAGSLTSQASVMQSPPRSLMSREALSIDEARDHFEIGLGLEYRGEETHPDVRVAFFGGGQVAVELLEPLDDQTDIGEFLARRGEGVHHLALKVEDVAIALAEAPGQGF